MKAKVTFEMDVTDFVNDSDYTFPEAVGKLKELIEEGVESQWLDLYNLKVEID